MSIYDQKQWLNWDPETKRPLQGLKSPNKWATYPEAKATGKPVGFWFIEEDPYFFLDIDHALQPDGTWSALATGLCQRFVGCYMEVSQSKTGLHIVGRGSVPPHACKNPKLGLELYDRDRFIAWTGLSAKGDADYEA